MDNSSTRDFFTLNLNQKPIVTIFPACSKVCKILFLEKTGNRKQVRVAVYDNIFQTRFLTQNPKGTNSLCVKWLPQVFV